MVVQSADNGDIMADRQLTGYGNMNVRKHQGLSLIGFLLVLVMALFLAFLAMRITPIYLEYYSVVSAMNGVASERGSAQYSPFDIKAKVLNRLYVSYTDGNVGEENIRVVRRNGVQLRVTYEVRKPIFGNLDIIASFDEYVQLSN